MSEAADVVTYRVEGGIAWVSFNRPEKRNAMSPTLNRRMLEVLDELEYRDDVGVLVLKGEGESWTAGMDLKEYFRETEAQGSGACARRSAITWLVQAAALVPKPTTRVNAGAGGGFGPLFACDLAIAADEAQYGLSEINWGILPGGGVTKVVVDLLSMRDAMYLALTGNLIDGKTAAAWRLVNESVPLAQLEARVTELANNLLQKNPVTIKAAKDAVRRVKEMTYDNAEDYLVRAQEAANFHDKTEGRKEGIRQFIDEKSYKPGLASYDLGKGK